MPYNSSAFEKQLAKYKQEKAAKVIAAGLVPAHDPHVVQSRASTIAGKILPNGKLAPESFAQEKAPVKEPEPEAVVTKKKKRPIYLRTWFLFWMFTIVSTVASPFIFKDEIAQVMQVGETVKASTGVDPFSITTYKNMIKGEPVGASSGGNALTASSINPMTDAVPEEPKAIPSLIGSSTSMDMNAVVNQAQDHAAQIVGSGSGNSMEYIEKETKRLQEMAKEFDGQFQR